MSKVESINELESDLFHADDAGILSDPVAARNKAMDYLARREYGKQELVQKLAAAGFEDTVAGEAVDKLADEGLQDDRRFIESFLQSRINQGKGPLRIRQELGERDLNSGMIEEALTHASQDWFTLAEKVRVKKFGPGLPREFRDKARQMRFLQYRGFESAHIQAAVSPRGED